MTIPFQPTLPPEAAFSDVEQLFRDEEPPLLWPGNQNSNLGTLRRVTTHPLQDAVDQINELYYELFVSTAVGYLARHEEQWGLPRNPPTLTVAQRRNLLHARMKKGPFTRKRRRDLIEGFIQSTFGDPIQLLPPGVELVAEGVPLRAEFGNVDDLFWIQELIEDFHYRVVFASTVDIDYTALHRELDRITPAGISHRVYRFQTDYDTMELETAGDLITDSYRSSSGEGDGRFSDSSTGIWPATTNQITNNSFETNVTGWTAGSNNTLNRVTSEFKFGVASGDLFKTTSTGAISASHNATAAIPSIGTKMHASVWVKARNSSSVGKLVKVRMTGPGGSVDSAPVALTTSWQRVRATRVATATGTATLTVLSHSSDFLVNDGMFIDGAQIEFRETATPFDTSTRTAARVEYPAELISATRGAIALRWRAGFASAEANNRPTMPRLFSWADDATHRITGYYNPVAGQFVLEAQNAGVTESITVNKDLTEGEICTVIFAWTSTELKISVNDGLLQIGGRTAFPAIAATEFDVGNNTLDVGTNSLNGDIFWLYTFVGEIWDTDVQRIYSFGDTDFLLGDLPALTEPTSAWHAVNQNIYVFKPPDDFSM